MRRRRFLNACAMGGSAFALSAAWTRDLDSARVLRVGTTPVFLDDKIGFLARWASYLSPRVGMRVEFVSRRSYRDIMGLLLKDELEAAWICGFPWVVNQARLRGLSIPLYNGKPLYQSYLIVPASDQKTASLADLAGKVYAFSDPDSNSGYLVPRTTLIKAGIDPDRHFYRTFYTWGHRNVVTAVADGLAQGGSVDGYVWDTLRLVAPSLVARTRVAWRSEFYGFPPLAVRKTLDGETEAVLHRALLGMGNDDEGKRLLAELNLTGFGAFEAQVFDSIARNVALVGNRASVG